MSGTLENCQGYPWRLSSIGLRRIPRGMMDMRTLLWISVLTSRGSYGSSWWNACGDSNRESTRTTWSTFTIILWSPSVSKFTATQSSSLLLQLKVWVERKLIGLSATSNARSLKFVLKLRRYSPHTFRMSWRTINKTISPWSINIGVTSSPKSRLNTKGTRHQPISRRSPLVE